MLTQVAQYKRFKLSILAALLLLFGNQPALAEPAEREKEKFDAAEMIMHHIQDAHEVHLWGNTSIPLPMLLISAEDGLSVFMSSKFDHGQAAYKGYYLDHGKAKRLNDINYSGSIIANEVESGQYSTMSWGAYFGGEDGAFINLSITKNVAALLFTSLLMIWLFGAAARRYKGAPKAPRGLAGFLEPLILFVRDDIAVPNIGEKNYRRFMPYLLTAFFLIWINNLLGLVPILAPNLSGNIAFTLVLALFTFVLTTISGKKPYWSHILAPPVPKVLWIVMIPIEIIGMITKPFALMIRLFANITAGHILILSLVSLIFIFESAAMSLLSIPFMVFMLTLKILVAALQAYIFTLLSALFIGMAVEEAH